MVNVLNTVIPIFVIILLGWFLYARGFIPGHLAGPLNRIVYYLAIPAMIFREVAEARFTVYFQLPLLIGTLIPVILLFLAASWLTHLFSVSAPYRGTFLQSSFHGNLGYIGLAVSYYFLGSEGFTSASILAAFLMLLNNLLAVLVLQAYSSDPRARGGLWFLGRKVVGNPVILSALAGMVFSMLGLQLPAVAERSLRILGGMALPLALLIIGASISFGVIRTHLRMALGAGFLKLLCLPGIGLLFYLGFGIPPEQFLPGLILLASPTATITYVMATEMQGSADLATAAVSVNTLISCATFIFWLGLWAA